MANILREKNQKVTLNYYFSSLKKVGLMVIDEIGFVPLHKDTVELARSDKARKSGQKQER